MEFWEGAILVVGGVWLVAHMAKGNQSQAGVIGTSIMGSAGTSNESNLTTITNTAGGYPSVWGEPLQPPQPPLSPAPYIPPSVTPVARFPVSYMANPRLGGPSSPVVPYRSGMVGVLPGGRPINVML